MVAPLVLSFAVPSSTCSKNNKALSSISFIYRLSTFPTQSSKMSGKWKDTSLVPGATGTHTLKFQQYFEGWGRHEKNYCNTF